MKSKTIRKLFFGIVLFVFPSLLFAQESLTITTYYPSPAGSYQDLEVVNLLTVNTNIMAGPAAVGANTWSVVNAATSVAAPANGDPRMAVFGRHNSSTTYGGLGVSGRWNVPGGGGNGLYYAAVLGWEPQPRGNVAVDRTYAGMFWGDVYISGAIRGCIPMSYGRDSVQTNCPAGYVVDASLSPAASVSEWGGVFYCCAI